MKLRNKKMTTSQADPSRITSNPEGTQVIPPKPPPLSLKELALQAVEDAKTESQSQQEANERKLLREAEETIFRILTVKDAQWRIDGYDAVCTVEGVPLRYGLSRHSGGSGLFLNRYPDDNTRIRGLVDFGQAIQSQPSWRQVQPKPPTTPEPRTVSSLNLPQQDPPPKHTRESILARFEE